MRDSAVNICQPGHSASCALCCGSHNFNAGPDEIACILSSRGRGEMRQMDDGICLFKDGTQCPHMGIIDEDTGTIGCLIYLRATDEDPAKSFFMYTCKNFSCRARETLSREEILFAARLMGDWYYYSLLINEITLLQGLVRKYELPERISPEELALLKQRLARLLRDPGSGAERPA